MKLPNFSGLLAVTLTIAGCGSSASKPSPLAKADKRERLHSYFEPWEVAVVDKVEPNGVLILREPTSTNLRKLSIWGINRDRLSPKAFQMLRGLVEHRSIEFKVIDANPGELARAKVRAEEGGILFHGIDRANVAAILVSEGLASVNTDDVRDGEFLRYLQNRAEAEKKDPNTTKPPQPHNDRIGPRRQKTAYIGRRPAWFEEEFLGSVFNSSLTLGEADVWLSDRGPTTMSRGRCLVTVANQRLVAPLKLPLNEPYKFAIFLRVMMPE